MLHPSTTETTPREFDAMNHEKAMFELQAQHQENLKRMELEVAKLDTKFASWLKIPIKIIMLPVYCLMAIGFIITAFREDKEPGQNFWSFLMK